MLPAKGLAPLLGAFTGENHPQKINVEKIFHNNCTTKCDSNINKRASGFFLPLCVENKLRLRYH